MRSGDERLIYPYIRIRVYIIYGLSLGAICGAVNARAATEMEGR